MSEERIGAHLRAVEADVTPDPRFLDALHDELAAELGLSTRRTGPRPATDAPVTPLRRPRPMPGSRTRLLLLAATIVVAGSAAAVVGSRLAPAPQERDDLLTLMRGDDRMRIGIVTGYPQAQAPDGAWGGFDVDVATRLAEGLGLPAELVVSSGADLVTRPETWDISFPSLGEAPLTTGAGHPIAATDPVYHWPVHVLVAPDDPATSVAALTDRRICVTAGSPGAAWAAGDTTIRSTTLPVDAPGGLVIVPAADDAGCLGLLATGEVDALVTATLGPADLKVRSTVRALGDPVLTLPMAPVVSTSGADPTELLAALDAEIAALRADGTLLDLSRRRFGADLVTPPTP